MEIQQHIYGMNAEGEAIIIYTMKGSNGSQVQICNLGATITSAIMPDKDGKLADVVLGFEDLENMLKDSASCGRTVGRVANRIADGKMTIEGTEYNLAVNNGPNHLHGGLVGFGSRIWESRVETNRVVMSLLSEDGDQSYPGELNVEVAFDFDDEGQLELTMMAKSDKTTVVNLTNHAYFNLSGDTNTTIEDHELQLCSTKVLEANAVQIPTGKELEVAGTPMDFSSFRILGEGLHEEFNHIKDFRGYDHFFVVDGYKKGVLAENAVLRDPKSRRSLTVLSSLPGLMVYTGNWLAAGSPITKGGKPYLPYQGVALECQYHPDAINQPSFPSIVLPAGELYCEKIVFKFGTY
ncbi:MAG: aldose epimerase family protein [Rikenellaceae bacterium]